MFTFLSRLLASFGRLADSIDALAATTTEANGRLRSQLQLDGPADPPRVIEHHDAEADADADDSHGKAARNGKKAKSAA